jgi:hypothetical protein
VMPASTDYYGFLKQPSDSDAKVWRYADFAKYVSMLEKGALWFTRADKLGESFEDNWETLSKEQSRARRGNAIVKCAGGSRPRSPTHYQQRESAIGLLRLTWRLNVVRTNGTANGPT